MLLSMFYRRKVIMAILQRWQGTVPVLDFQKILFLFCQKQDKPAYEFVPYLYGGFSFQSYADKRTMTKYGMIHDKENEWDMKDNTDYISSLRNEDRDTLDTLYSEIKDIKGGKLVRYVYKKYPYYAIKSKMLDVLTEEEVASVEKENPVINDFELFTIGYEGRSVEAYLNILIKNDVRVLCDVRRNPISMKYGFSKRQLEGSTEKVGIRYIHIPELGIDSEKRQNLETKEDYEKLFKEYEKEMLPSQQSSLQQVIELMKTNKRVALTCFEGDYNFCHRSRTASALLNLPGWNYPVKHL